MIPWLKPDDPFPDIASALSGAGSASGLLAASANIWPDRLLEAYKKGIFPWFSPGQPVLWWSTDPRMVLPTDRFVISHSLKKKLNQVRKSMMSGGKWLIRFDSAFQAVMQACAEPRKGQHGTWISGNMIENYIKLHEMGYAHSTELWLEGELVGGAYGVAIGKMFYGESMFARVSDASKIALAWLIHFLRNHGVRLIDCQQETAHLASLGGISLSREAFAAHLAVAVNQPPIIGWTPLMMESL